jgi:hypothetical protein
MVTSIRPAVTTLPKAIRAGLPEAGGYGLDDLRCCLVERP